MNSKTLILMTEGFPYGTTEAFLETEILYLSQAFQKIIICTPNTIKSNDNLRPVPSNCEILILNELKLSKFQKFIFVLHPVFIKEMIGLLFKNKTGISIYKLKVALQYLSEAKSISKELNKINDKHSYLYSYWSDKNAMALCFVKTSSKKFARCHRWDVYAASQKENYLPYRKFLLENLDQIFSISEDGIKEIESNWSAANLQKASLSRLGVEKQDGGFDFSLKRIVSCSNLIKVKQLEKIIAALALIKQEVEWIHFGDGIERKSLEKLARELIPENIHFQFYGHVSNTELMNFYKFNKASLFVNVSASEGIPVSIMEAMSFGIPVIATNVGGTSEIVNNKNGKLLKNVEPDYLANEIRSYFALSEAEVKEKSDEAVKTWQQKFNAEKNYTDFIKQILK